MGLDYEMWKKKRTTKKAMKIIKKDWYKFIQLKLWD
jgi:hypothetical protein